MRPTALLKRASTPLRRRKFRGCGGGQFLIIRKRNPISTILLIPSFSFYPRFFATGGPLCYGAALRLWYSTVLYTVSYARLAPQKKSNLFCSFVIHPEPEAPLLSFQHRNRFQPRRASRRLECAASRPSLLDPGLWAGVAAPVALRHSPAHHHDSGSGVSLDATGPLKGRKTDSVSPGTLFLLA